MSLALKSIDNPPPSISKGLAGVVADETAVSQVRGEEGALVYRGIPIEALAYRSSFEEMTFFLLQEQLPRAEELSNTQIALQRARPIPKDVADLIDASAARAHPMAVLQTAVAALSFYLPQAPITNRAKNVETSLEMISRVATIAARISRIRRGLVPVEPRTDLSHAENILYMFFGRVPDSGDVRVFETALILHMDHDFNASTFSARVIGSTEAGICASVSGALGALSGPLHGGANERVMEMVANIGSADAVPDFIQKRLASKGKVPGFGHRVYRTVDPRAVVIRDALERLVGKTGQRHDYDILAAVEKTMVETLGNQNKDYIRENVDFWSGALFKLLGFSHEDFTPIFAIARTVGWCSHLLEMWKDNRIYRPAAQYVGPVQANYLPINER
jgi:citrate synthase